MTYKELLENARHNLGAFCKACTTCNGVVCKNIMPGPGAKGVGDLATRNYEKWQELYVNMDTIYPSQPIETRVTLFNRAMDLPIFAGPVGAVKLHYGDMYDDLRYNEILIEGCRENGIIAFTGDGIDPNVMISAASAIKQQSGMGIPTIKPWDLDTIKEKLTLVENSGAAAVAMDIDAAGLPFLKNLTPPAGVKSTQELSEIIALTSLPFIVKGVMTVKGALKAKQAGAAGIVVSNHGGRVLDGCPATAQVLYEIAQAVGGDMTVLVDGGIRTGLDVFRALALGADGVIIARPFVTAVYGGGKDGVGVYIQKLKSELIDTMSLCAAVSISSINKDMLYNK